MEKKIKFLRKNFDPSYLRIGSAYARPLSLKTSVFPDMWKLSHVTPIFKKGRRNNVKNYREVMAILSAIPKCFELLFYRTMYSSLKNLISVMKNGSTVTNLLEYASFVLYSSGRWIPFTRTFQRLLIE
jgi:hypothetical protein